MRKFLTSAMACGAIALTGCGDTPEETAVKEAALRVCSADQILKDTSSFSNDVADPALAQEEWLAANGKRDGVKTTPSGLQYLVNKSGNPKGPRPLPAQTVRVNYHGQFIDGKKFDSSFDRGQDIEFALNRVIKGWTEGVGLMRPCDAWTLYIPYELAYGAAGRPPAIPAKSPLVFHVQLIEVSDK